MTEPTDHDPAHRVLQALATGQNWEDDINSYLQRSRKRHDMVTAAQDGLKLDSVEEDPSCPADTHQTHDPEQLAHGNRANNKRTDTNHRTQRKTTNGSPHRQPRHTALFLPNNWELTHADDHVNNRPNEIQQNKPAGASATLFLKLSCHTSFFSRNRPTSFQMEH